MTSQKRINQSQILVCRDEHGNQMIVKSIQQMSDEERIHASIPYHPHVLPLQDIFHVGDVSHLVMDYCPRGDLFTALKQAERFPLRKAIETTLQIGRGMLHLHENGIAHRDLSLENILLGGDNDYKICDFGVATMSLSCTEIVGKPTYMAPEVFGGEEYDPFKADIWSLGIILFMVLTGVPLVLVPCTKDKRFRMIEAYGVHSLVNLWDMEAYFSESILELLELMLEIDPCSRLSIYEVVHALEIELDIPCIALTRSPTILTSIGRQP